VLKVLLLTFRRVIFSSEWHVSFDQELYPYNYMRNTAMNNTSTAYIFITDIDFIPMPNAYQVLYKYIRAGLPGKTEVKLR